VAQVTPLLAELREAGIVSHVEGLASLASDTASDIRELQRSVLDKENVGELRKSVKTLTRTLQHIESIAGEVSAASADAGAVASLRQLIEAFSRLVAD
jgi:acyl-[acyl carrier protein]--UDP-N-acetylglucosamine O-acyltransferase